MAEKETHVPEEPAPKHKASIEKELGVAKVKADELGIEVGHVQNFKGADKMFAYASADAMSIDEETNKKLVRKIDLNVLPWLCVLYVLQYLDKGV
jgi:ACS family allantoate permease-like MFS transporter